MEQHLSQELEEMKQQISLLKDKLENQNIINEQIFRNTLKDKVSNINRTALIQCTILIAAIPLCFFNLENIGASMAFNLFTNIFLLIALVYTWWSHKGLNTKAIVTDDLIKTAEKAIRTRKLYKRWYYFSYPWLFVWLIWLGWEFYNISENIYMLIGLTAGALIGGIVGGTWGWLQKRKIFQNIDDILTQIKNIQETDK